MGLVVYNFYYFFVSLNCVSFLPNISIPKPKEFETYSQQISKMAGMDLQLSSIVIIAALVLVVVGLVISIFFYFKRAENLTEEDRLNIERVKIAWIGAAALGVLAIVASRKEKHHMHMTKKSTSSARASAGLV
tara:strand:- start:105902 stop:106300 length:399 start_codon:yes stop_codon:yes gene_type:complete